MTKLLIAAAAFITAGFANPAAARNITLEPSSNWVLDYAEDSCALRRLFGEGKQRAQLEMRRFQPGVGLQTVVMTNATRATDEPYRFRFDSDGEWTNVKRPLYARADKFQGVIFRHRLIKHPPRDETDGHGDAETEPEAKAEPELGDWVSYFSDISMQESAAAAQIRVLTISRAFMRDLVLNTGPLEKPLLALNHCVEELMSHWGIDVEAHKTRTRSALPVNSPSVWRIIKYPPNMAQRGLPGLVNIRLDVDETGRVTECHIQMPLSDPAFERSSCTAIQGMLEFEPALDKDGTPMKSYFVTSVHFAMN